MTEPVRHEYRSMREFLRAVKRGEVPEDLVSPGWVASEVGVSRQAVHQMIGRGGLESWHVLGGYVFVRVDSVNLWR